MPAHPGQQTDLYCQTRIRKEEERLKKNKERRQQREKQKGGARFVAASATPAETAMSPAEGSAEPSIEKGGTTRRCANCGQVGHIKTNKK